MCIHGIDILNWPILFIQDQRWSTTFYRIFYIQELLLSIVPSKQSKNYLIFKNASNHVTNYYEIQKYFLYTFTFVDTLDVLLWAKCSSNFYPLLKFTNGMVTRSRTSFLSHSFISVSDTNMFNQLNALTMCYVGEFKFESIRKYRWHCNILLRLLIINNFIS